MRGNKVFWICLIAFLVCICVISLLARKERRTEPKLSLADSIIIESKREHAFEKKIEEADYTELLKDSLTEFFTRIDAIMEISIYKSKDDNLKDNKIKKVDDVLLYPLDIQGHIYGKPKKLPKTVAKGGKYYSFSITGSVAENKIEFPCLDKTSVRIWARPNREGKLDLIYFRGEDVDSVNIRYIEWYIERKKEEEEKKNKEDDTRFKVDGIQVVYDTIEGASYVYKSYGELTPKQIIKAIEKIGPNGMNMIQFNIGDTHYADYVYSTQCIIYPSTHDIYKVVNGKPVRAN